MGNKRPVKFTMRPIFVLVLLGGVTAAAWIAYIAPYRHEQSVAKLVEELRGTVRTETIFDPGRAEGLFPRNFFSRIHEIDLSKTSVEDADLEQIRDLPRLRCLRLNQTKISDAGLVKLVNLPELRVLELRGANITAAGVRSLPERWPLEELHLSGPAITDEALPAIARYEGLAALSLAGTRISDAGLEHLDDLTDLEELQLPYNNIGDAGMAHLSRLAELDHLNVIGTRLTDAALPQLARLTDLDTLEVRQTGILPAALRRAVPWIVRAPVLVELNRRIDLTVSGATFEELLGRLSEVRRITVVPSRLAAQQMLNETSKPFSVDLEDRQLGEVLRHLFIRRGLRPVIRYGCIQLITAEDAERETVRMTAAQEQPPSQRFCHALHDFCPEFRELIRFSPVDEGFLRRCSLSSAAEAWQSQLGIEVKLDDPAFADHPELLNRQIAVPLVWNCNLGSALEFMLELFDAHGVLQGDTLLLRPGAAPRP